MSKVTLNQIASLKDATTALTAINTNTTTIQNYVDNTLSRDGTAPNEMNATLDMNSNRIINLPAPVGTTEPTRLADLAAFETTVNTALEDIAQTVTYIDSSGAISLFVNNMSTMKLLTLGALPDGCVVTLKGFYATSDGGEGQFVWNASSITTDDGGTVIQRTAGGTGRFFRLKPEGQVSAKWFGAKGDGTTDDTTNLQKFVNYIAANRSDGFVPAGTYIHTGLNFNSVVASIQGFTLRGAGKGNTTFKLKNSTNTNNFTLYAATTIANGGGNFNIHFEGFTLDGNSVGQSGNYYVLAVGHVKNLSMYDVEIKGVYGSSLWLSESDTAGSGPGGRAATPFGEYFNYNIDIRNCIFDGTAQQAFGDMVVLGRIDGLVFDGNHVFGSRASLLSSQFNKNFAMTNNRVDTFMRGMYFETCLHGLVSGNQVHDNSTQFADAQAVGIWLTTGDESYPAIGYAGCSDVAVTDNFVYNINRASGVTGCCGILCNAVQSSGLTANRNTISDNVIYNISSNAEAFGIQLTGGTFFNNINSNIIDTVTATGVDSVAIDLGDLFASTQTNVGVTVQGNQMHLMDKGVLFHGSGTNDYTNMTGNTCITVTTAYTPGSQSHIVNADNIG